MNATVLMRHSLKTRLTLAMLVVFLMSFWSLSFYVGRMLRSDMEQLIGDQQFSTVTLVADQLNNELEARQKALKLVAGTAGQTMQGASPPCKA